MSASRSRSPPCLFCRKDIDSPSRDHIFPAFLGGKRTIIVCKYCNDYFGHSIEAATADGLRPLQVVLSSGGVPLKSTKAIWKKAFSANSHTIDLYISDTGMAQRLSAPVVELDENGGFRSGQYRSVGEAEDAMKRLEQKGNFLKRQNLERLRCLRCVSETGRSS